MTGLRTAAGQARELARQCRYLRVAAVAWRFAMRHVPKWLRRLLVACLAIPGPFDELAALLVVVVFLGWALRSAGARRELAASVRSAWAGISLPETTNARMCVMLSAGFHGREERDSDAKDRRQLQRGAVGVQPATAASARTAARGYLGNDQSRVGA